MAGRGRASASGRRATSRKSSSSPTPLIKSVVRVIRTLPCRILSSRSLAGFANKGGKANDEPTEDEKDNERCANGGVAG